MKRLTNDELLTAIDSKLRRGATYTAQDVVAFALGVEWAQDTLIAPEIEKWAERDDIHTESSRIYARLACAVRAGADDATLARLVRQAVASRADLELAAQGPIESHVRPERWLCQSCAWTGADADLLRAQSPFDEADTIVGCPKCKAVEVIVSACDEPGCDREATCGFPALGGYRRTCGEHFNWLDEMEKS